MVGFVGPSNNKVVGTVGPFNKKVVTSGVELTKIQVGCVCKKEEGQRRKHVSPLSELFLLVGKSLFDMCMLLILCFLLCIRVRL